MPRTIRIKLYSIDELSFTACIHAIEMYRHMNRYSTSNLSNLQVKAIIKDKNIEFTKEGDIFH